MSAIKKRQPWHFGNTTVRSPFRLKDGLLLISQSSLQGNLHGEEAEKAFRDLLGSAGIVELGDDDTYSVGRKWRGALSQLGFIYPLLPKNSEVDQSELGVADTITPNGWRLIAAESVSAIQECFLRSLSAYYDDIHTSQDENSADVFSPLRHVFRLMLTIEKITGEPYLSFLEMACIVQFSNPAQSIEETTQEILELREKRSKAERKKVFDRDARYSASIKFGYKAQTLNDYADVNFRYLKATGLVQSKGRGVVIIPEKHLFVQKLCEQESPKLNQAEFLKMLTDGAQLPTDDSVVAYQVVTDLVKQLDSRGVNTETVLTATQNAADLNLIRHNLEDQLFMLNEEDYGRRQSSQWKDISNWLYLLSQSQNSALTLDDGERMSIPSGEAPAYFEWAIWRAFLAINSLVSPPYKCRRFKIDQDFLPVGTAPGGGPDLIFEFEDFVIVGEVTLTTNSRQEAAEGEPVRRHVANVLETFKGNKTVFGLFLANKIDSNTAETFRIGTWYTNDDQKVQLDIVPLPLLVFKKFFDEMFISGKVDVRHLKDLLNSCVAQRMLDAPLWKQKINEVVGHLSQNFEVTTSH